MAQGGLPRRLWNKSGKALSRLWRWFSTPESDKHVFWVVSGRLLALVGLGALIFSVWSGISALVRGGPELQIRLYEFDERGQPRLVDPSLDRTLDFSDIEAGAVEFPLNIALRNVGGRSITSATVELAYPEDLDISATGARKVDPDSHVLIFERPLSALHVESNYTLLEPLDRLRLRVYPIPVDAVVLTAEDFPIYVRTVVTVFRTTADGFPLRPSLDDAAEFEVGVVDQDGERYSGRVRLSFPFDVSLVPQYEGTPGIETDLDDKSLRLVRETASTGSPMTKRTSTLGSREIVYWEALSPQGDFVQLVWVAGELRRAMVDLDSDGELDFELWDLTGDGEFDQKRVFDPSEPVQRWPNEAFISD